jgi:hypothetical protein
MILLVFLPIAGAHGLARWMADPVARTASVH